MNAEVEMKNQLNGVIALHQQANKDLETLNVHLAIECKKNGGDSPLAYQIAASIATLTVVRDSFMSQITELKSKLSKFQSTLMDTVSVRVISESKKKGTVQIAITVIDPVTEKKRTFTRHVRPTKDGLYMGKPLVYGDSFTAAYKPAA